MACILLAVFNQLYCENQEQKGELKDFKNLKFGQKNAPQTWVNESVFIEEITVIKEMLNTLNRDIRKDALRTSRKLQDHFH